MLHSLWEKIIIITVSPRFYQNHHHYSLTTISITINQNLFVHKPTIPQSLNLDPTNLFQPFHNQKKLITNHVDVNGPTKLFPVRLINFHTRTHIVTWIALRWSRRAERERERGRDSLMKRNLIKMDVNPCGGHWFPDLLEPGWQASSLLPGLFQDRRVSRSHTCIINETCHAARAINFDVQIRSDTDATLTTKRHTLHAQTFRNAAATRAA